MLGLIICGMIGVTLVVDRPRPMVTQTVESVRFVTVTTTVERVIERPAPWTSTVTDLVYRGTGTVEIGDLLYRGSSSSVTTMPLTVEGAR